LDNIAFKYSRFIILLIAIGPFVAYVTYDFFDIDFNRIMQLLSYIGVFLMIFIKDKNKIVFPKYLIFYLLFILYVYYSAFIQLDREFDVKYLFSNKLIAGFNFFFIIENLHVSSKFYKKIIRISIGVFILAVMAILIQQAFNKNFFIRTDLVEGNVQSSDNTDRLHSIYSWISFFGNGLGFVPIFILIVEYLDRKKKKILIWVVFGVIYLILTKGRWIMLNGILVFVILFVNKKNQSVIFFKYLLMIPFLILSSAIVLNVIGIDTKGIVEDRILETNKKDLSKKTAGTRLLAFTVFNKLYWDNAFFGVGSIKYGMGGTGKQDLRLRQALGGRSSQLHVGYLSVLYMYGLVGGSFFYIFLYLMLKRLYRDAKRTTFWAPFLGILGFAIANLTLVTFRIFEVGLVIVFVANKFYVQQAELKEALNNKRLNAK